MNIKETAEQIYQLEYSELFELFTEIGKLYPEDEFNWALSCIREDIKDGSLIYSFYLHQFLTELNSSFQYFMTGYEKEIDEYEELLFNNKHIEYPKEIWELNLYDIKELRRLK